MYFFTRFWFFTLGRNPSARTDPYAADAERDFIADDRIFISLLYLLSLFTTMRKHYEPITSFFER